MPIEPLNGPFSPYGADSPRELERKINGNFAQLYAVVSGGQLRPVNLTVDTAGSPLDTPRTLQLKINTMLYELAELRGESPSTVQPVSTTRSYPVHGGLRQAALERLFLQQWAAANTGGASTVSSTPSSSTLPTNSVGGMLALADNIDARLVALGA